MTDGLLPGADRDLARAIHHQLVLALEIEPAKILPGGFHVLRNAPVPAALGEPAMVPLRRMLDFAAELRVSVKGKA